MEKVNSLSQQILQYLNTVSSYRATRKYSEIFKSEQGKLTEELVGQQIQADDYNVIAQKQFDGSADDYVSTIEFDSNTKKFKSLQNVIPNNERNLTNSMIDCILYPLKENFNDRHDKLFSKSIKNILLLFVNNLFTLKISAFQDIFETLSVAQKTARKAETKAFIRSMILKIFDIINHRLTLCNYFFKSQNPLHYFYESSTQKFIRKEIQSSLNGIVDHVQLKHSKNQGYLLDLQNNNHQNQLKQIEGDQFNELGIKAGRFGWCLICRKSAWFYCKEQKIPICSFECKLKNMDNIDQLKKLINNDKQNELKEILFKQEYIKVFEKLSEKCFNQESEKERIFYLEILLDMVKNPSNALKRDAMFIIFIKKNVLPHLTITTLHNEQNVLKTSLIIFLNLVFNFRKYLRVEIGIYIKDVFLEILESVNSRYVFKYYVLQVLTTLIEEKTLPFELFLNYDCREGSINICENIIDLLVKITQGKYSKNIYATMISLEQEEKLRKEAREGIVHLITGCQIFLNSQKQKQTKKVQKDELFNSTIEIQQKSFREVLQKKKQIDECMNRFNAGKSRALQQLINLGVLGEGPENLAFFLKNDKRVQPFVIGEIFGGEDDFHIKVMKIYLGYLNFKDMTILQAMRYYLNLFEMPGEGQKVERILEQFSKKYSEENNHLYTEDGAYLLSFLLMMLHTNVYNPKVVDKMSLADFLNIGKNIKNNEEQIDPEILTGFYYDIQQEPIAIHSLEKRKNEIQAILNQNQKKKTELFRKETQLLIENYSSKIKDFEINQDFQELDDPAVLQIFISTMWSSLLAFFSTSIATAPDIDSLRLLVDSTMTMIKLSDVFNMQTERDSFINILVQFSGLEKTFNKLLDDRNQLVIQAILSIASKMGNHLHTGWKFVLHCIVSLNYYQILADEITPTDLQTQNLSIKYQNAIFVTHYFTKDDLNKIFSESHHLDEESILDFFQGLSQLALKEIDQKGTRIDYILQQIVVVMNLNVHRNPLEWLRIWQIIDKLYENIISKNSQDKSRIIIFSIDILKQLVMCCFRNQQLLQQKYQTNILQVYITICSNKRIDGDIVDYLLISFQSLLLQLKDDIKTGISTIISTLNLCCSCAQSIDDNQQKKTNEIQLEILNLLKFITDNVDNFSVYMKNDIPYILILLSKICKRPYLPTIMKSLELQNLYYNLFWNQQSLENNYSSNLLDNFNEIKNDPQKLLFHNQNIYFQNFILKTLENLVEYPSPVLNDQFKEVVNKIFELSNKISPFILMDSWVLLLEKVFQKLLHKLQLVYLANPQAIEDFKELFIFCGKQTLNLIFTNNINPVKLIKIMFSFMLQVSECKNRMVLDCLTLNLNDTISIAANLDDENPWIKEIWEEIINYLTTLFENFFPKELTDNEIWQVVSEKQQPIELSNLQCQIFQNKEFVAFKCKFVLNLLKLIQIIIKKTELLQESQEQILQLLDKFIKHSEEFNNNSINRYILWKKGYFSMKNSLPSLHIFEKNVTIVKLIDYQRMYNKGNSKIFVLISQIFDEFQKKLIDFDNFLEIYQDQSTNIFIENEFNEEYKAKTLEEKQKNVINFYNLITENIEPFLLNLDFENIEYIKHFDEIINKIIDFLPFINIHEFQKMKIANFNPQEDQEKNKNPKLIGEVLRKFIELKLKKKQYNFKKLFTQNNFFIK